MPLSLFTAILSISQVDFLSFNISGEELSEIGTFDLSLVCRRNIPQIILPLNVSDSQSQAPIAIDLPRLREERDRKLGERTTLQLNESSINTIPGDQKMVSCFMPP